MLHPRRFIPLLLLLAVFGPAGLTAGWILTGKYIDKDGNTILQRYFIQDHKVKFEQYNIIYTLDESTGDMILVDPQALLYYKSTVEGYIKDLKKYRQNQLETLLKDVPAGEQEQTRELYRKNIENTGNAPFTFTDTLFFSRLTDSLRIAGMPSEKFLVSAGGRKLEEIWIVPGLDISKQFSWSTYLHFLSLVAPDTPALPYMVTPGFRQLLDSGFPGRRIMIVSGYRTEYQLNKLEIKTIPDYEFSTPAICKQVSLKEWLERDINSENPEDDYE